MDRTTDALIWEAIQEDDHRSFEILFIKYYPELRRQAYYYCGQYEDAEEIAADVLHKLWMRRKETALESSLKAYLVTSVRNAAFNVLRKKRQVIEELTDVMPVQDTGAWDEPGVRLLLRETESDILRALDGLPERQKEVFRLQRLHDYSVAEIAGMMGITEGTVHTQLYKAVKKLRNYFRSRSGGSVKPFIHEEKH